MAGHEKKASRRITPDELLARIGSAEISAHEVLSALYPELAAKRSEIDAKRGVAGLEAEQG